MNYSESLPLNDRYDERDVAARDLDAGRHSDQRAGTAPHRSRSYRSSDFKNAQSRSGRPSITRRVTRSLAGYFFAVLIGVGGTLGWQSYGDEAKEMLRTWVPSLSWLIPISTETPAPAVTSAELQEKLKPVALDVAIVRRSTEQLAFNQDQLARKQEQMTQAIAALQAAEQDISQKILALAPPASKPVHVSPKPVQPAAQ